jgi:hypothetical protein
MALGHKKIMGGQREMVGGSSDRESAAHDQLKVSLTDSSNLDDPSRRAKSVFFIGLNLFC